METMVQEIKKFKKQPVKGKAAQKTENNLRKK